MEIQSRHIEIAAGVSVPSWIISIAVDTLPLVQWLAGVLAIVVGVIAITRHFRK